MIWGWTESHGARLVALDNSIRPQRGIERISEGELADCVDVVIATGGDATLLRALAVAAPAGVPVLGVNVGGLGFLADVEPPELTAALDAIAAGCHKVEERVALEAHVRSDTTDHALRASSHIVLARVAGHGQAALAVSIDGELLPRYVGDGLILSTPTGYAGDGISAGRPIVSPACQTLLVAPLAPHGVANPSLIVDAAEHIEIQILPGSAQVVIQRDGARHGEVTAGTCVNVTRSAYDDLLIRFGATNLYGRARRNLQLVNPQRPS